MDLFAKRVNDFQTLSIFPKYSILDVWQDSEYTYVRDGYCYAGYCFSISESFKDY